MENVNLICHEHFLNKDTSLNIPYKPIEFSRFETYFDPSRRISKAQSKFHFHNLNINKDIDVQEIKVKKSIFNS